MNVQDTPTTQEIAETLRSIADSLAVIAADVRARQARERIALVGQVSRLEREAREAAERFREADALVIRRSVNDESLTTWERNHLYTSEREMVDAQHALEAFRAAHPELKEVMA